MAFIDPTRTLRRSQIYRWHASQNAVFVGRSDAVFVDHYSGSGDENKAAGRLGVCDLSLLRRDGLTGAGSNRWLLGHGYEPPQRPNTSVTQSNGDLLVRMSAEEYLCLRLSDLGDSDRDGQSDWAGDDNENCYPAPRADSHCLFAVTGSSAATLFSKLCAVDLRPHKFENGCVAQTSVARVNAIVIRHDMPQTHNFYLMAATSAAEYLWECLLDAMAEFGGEPIGISALRAIARPRP
ncbi:MAG: sarcosine oxidase [Woeseiaceae bacterium]